MIMFFSSLIIDPILHVLLLLLLAVIWRRAQRWLLIFAIFYLYIVSVPFSYRLLSAAWAIDDTFEQTSHYDAVLPLAGIADYTWYLQRVDKPRLGYYFRFNQNSARIIDAVDLLLSGQVRRLILTEDKQVPGFDEVLLLGDFARQHGIPPDYIEQIGSVKNTHDEAIQAKRYLERNLGISLVLVTSENHMRRAAATFRKQGISPILLSSGRVSHRIKPNHLIPSATNLQQIKTLWHEMLAYIVYSVKGYL